MSHNVTKQEIENKTVSSSNGKPTIELTLKDEGLESHRPISKEDFIAKIKALETQEHIFVFSPDEAAKPDRKALRNVTLAFTQQDHSRLRQKQIKVYDDRFLSVSERNLFQSKSYWINLHLLDVQPQDFTQRFTRQKQLAVSLIVAGLAAIVYVFAAPVLFGASQAVSGYLAYGLALLAALMQGAGLCLLYYYRDVKLRAFKSINGGAQLITMLRDSPDTEEFRRCSQKLIRAIQRAKAQCYYSSAQQLAIELAEHRRLRNEGIVSEAHYMDAKSKLFRCHKTQRGNAEKPMRNLH